MNFDSLCEALRRRSVAQTNAARDKHLHMALRAQQDARAAEAQRLYGDAFAGLDARGRVILWRASPIPTIRKRADY